MAGSSLRSQKTKSQNREGERLRRLDGAMLFAPAGELVPVAIRALGPGGTLAVAGIWLSDLPPLNYQLDLFQER